MAVLYACQIKYGATAERISVELETAEPGLAILRGILKLVRRGLKRVDTAMFFLIDDQKNTFLPNCFKYNLKMLPIEGGTIGTPAPIAVIVVRVVLMVKGGQTVSFPGQEF